MNNIKATKSFRKGLKRYQYDKKALKEIEEVLLLLQASSRLPAKYEEHKLLGKFSEFWECHVCPDLLLIYRRFEDDNLIVLRDVGSHNYLFG